MDIKKFLDQEGLIYLWEKLSLQDYPNNDTLVAVINAIDENKANKTDIKQSDWEQTDEEAIDFIKNKPVLDNLDFVKYTEQTLTDEQQQQARTNIDVNYATDEEILSAMLAEDIIPAIQIETGELLSSDENTILANITFQTIEELPFIEEATDSTSFVAWDGEQTVRVSKDAIQSQSGNGQPHQQFVTNGDGVTMWTEKLAYEDSILRGIFSIDVTPESFTQIDETTWNVSISGNYIDDLNDISYIIKYNGEVVSPENAVVEEMKLSFSVKGTSGNAYNGYINIVESGVYTINILNNSNIAPDLIGTFEVYIVNPYIKTIDPKFLPEGNIAVSVTTDNNGQFLRVVNGTWAAVSLPNAEEAKF